MNTQNSNYPKNFSINFTQEHFCDLRERITNTRLINFRQKEDWSLGTPTSILFDLMNNWAEYDWTPQQDYLNQFPQFVCDIDGVNVHFFHIKSAQPQAVPILMAHGWPDSFLRYSKTFPLLKDYDLIVPSIPGFGFSSLPAKGWINNYETSEIWHELMTSVLGYERYFATGGDMGRGVLLYLASNYAEEVIGLYLTDVGAATSIITSPDEKLTKDELAYKQAFLDWMRKDGAYINIQGTKPYSLGVGLADSPVGMAGWLVEKFHDWSDWERFSMNDLLDNLTLYWMTNCAASSITAYHGNSFTLPPLGDIKTPIGIARFPHDILPAPKEWIEKNYNLVHYTDMPYGGHFTAMEAPEPFAADLKVFIDKILQNYNKR